MVRTSARTFRSAFLVLLVTAALHAQESAPASREQWLIMTIGGEPGGYVHRTTERVDDLVRHTERSHMRVTRLGATMEIIGESVSLERSGGGPVRIEIVQDVSARESRTVTVFEDDSAKIAMTTAGRTQNSERSVPADLIGPYGLDRRVVARLGEPGAEIEATVWLAEFGGPVDVWAKVVGDEEVELHDGRRERLVRVEFEVESVGMRATTWYDAAGDEVRSALQMVGVEIGTRRATREEALATVAGEAKPTPDLFVGSMITESVFLPAPRSAQRAVLRVGGRGGPLPVEIIEDTRQRVLETAGDEACFVELRAVVPIAGRGGVRPLTEPSAELQRFLATSSTLQSDAPEIIALAREAVGDETDAWRAACAIERWVAENVTDKNYSVAFASALEVAEDRAGDCSEHAVLMCALCRAAGIPARVAMGLLYIGGIWGGHAWNEVWIDGGWYALDPTIGAGSVDALHLTLAKLALEDASSGGEFGALMASLGRLSVAVVELTSGVRVELGAAAGRMEDGRYIDPAFGVSLRVPDGLEPEVQRPEQGIRFELLRARGRLSNGERLRVSLRAYDPGLDGGWPAFVPLAAAEPTEIDGRTALRVLGADDEDRTLRVLVRANRSVFELKIESYVEATKAAVESMLESVELDGEDG